MLQTSEKILIYRGYDQSDIAAICQETSVLWHHVQMPTVYLVDNWPVRAVVISPDGRYVAIAGRRGLAHYSVNSGRWKTFVNEAMEQEFVVRGGMCWYQHILIAAVECDETYEVSVLLHRLSRRRVETEVPPSYDSTPASSISTTRSSCISKRSPPLLYQSPKLATTPSLSTLSTTHSTTSSCRALRTASS